MSADRAINILVTITLIQLMVAIGLGVTFVDIARRPELGLGCPGRIGQLCPGSCGHCRAVVAVSLAPAGRCRISRGRRLSGRAIWAAVHGHGKRQCADFNRFDGDAGGIVGDRRTLLLHVLLPVTSGEALPSVDVSRMVGTLFLTQLIPLGIGLTIRHCRQQLADRLRKPANRLSVALNRCGVRPDCRRRFPSSGIHKGDRARGDVAPGHCRRRRRLAAGWPGPRQAKAMAFSTGARNVSVSLVIVTASFPGTPAVTACAGLMRSSRLPCWRYWPQHGAAGRASGSVASSTRTARPIPSNSWRTRTFPRLVGAGLERVCARQRQQ